MSNTKVVRAEGSTVMAATPAIGLRHVTVVPTNGAPRRENEDEAAGDDESAP